MRLLHSRLIFYFYLHHCQNIKTAAQHAILYILPFRRSPWIETTTMKRGCPDCVPGPNGACPAHKGGPGRNKRKRMKKLSYEISKERERQAKSSTVKDRQPEPNGAFPKSRDNPGRNKRKRLKKLKYEANNERNYQARIALERRLDLVEGRLPKGTRLNFSLQDEPSYDITAVPGTAFIPGAQKALDINNSNEDSEKDYGEHVSSEVLEKRNEKEEKVNQDDVESDVWLDIDQRNPIKKSSASTLYHSDPRHVPRPSTSLIWHQRKVAKSTCQFSLGCTVSKQVALAQGHLTRSVWLHGTTTL